VLVLLYNVRRAPRLLDANLCPWSGHSLLLPTGRISAQMASHTTSPQLPRASIEFKR
jgi:hypothetical protein